MNYQKIYKLVIYQCNVKQTYTDEECGPAEAHLTMVAQACNGPFIRALRSATASLRFSKGMDRHLGY